MNDNSKRIQSIDALRGFDMVWIMGAPGIILALDNIFGGKALGWLNVQMEHVPWDGFHIMDMVFPLFLFIAGISFPFSLAKRRQKGDSDAAIYRHNIKRAVMLVLLGIMYNGFLNHLDFCNARYASVLAHIGLAWFIGTLIFMNTDKSFVRIIWVAAILLGYGLLNALVLSPNATGTNPFVPENNIVTQFDRWFLPGKLYRGIYDPEGILSLVPAVATAMLGMLSGDFLRKEYADINPSRKAAILLLTGVLLILASLVVKIFIPLNKALWSSSFAILTGGLNMSLLAIFYWIIDVRNCRKWSFFFVVIGMNSLAIYLAQQIIDFEKINEFFLSGLAALFSPHVGALILSCGYVACCWLFLYFLYKKKIFIKI